MKQHEVPQEKNQTLDGNRKAVYAINEEGKYTTVASQGWSAEEIVTSQAVEEFDRLAQEALKRVHQGEASPLAYHMYHNRMDLSLLAQTTGFFKWTIRRDFYPYRFKKMAEKRALRYATALNITVDELKHIPNGA